MSHNSSQGKHYLLRNNKSLSSLLFSSFVIVFLISPHTFSSTSFLYSRDSSGKTEFLLSAHFRVALFSSGNWLLYFNLRFSWSLGFNFFSFRHATRTLGAVMIMKLYRMSHCHTYNCLFLFILCHYQSISPGILLLWNISVMNSIPF